MGDMADAILEGDFCQFCGVYLGVGEGIPRSCTGCKDDEDN